MLSSITLATTVRLNLIALQQIAGAIGDSQIRLATGRRDSSSSLSVSASALAINELLASEAAGLLTDPNEEAATLLALQTRRSLALISLSLANARQSDVLRLFGH